MQGINATLGLVTQVIVIADLLDNGQGNEVFRIIGYFNGSYL